MGNVMTNSSSAKLSEKQATAPPASAVTTSEEKRTVASPDLSWLRSIKHFALDMDGTIYSGGTLFADTIPFLKLVKQLGVGYSFLTNNSSKSVPDYVAHVRRMGIDASSD